MLRETDPRISRLYNEIERFDDLIEKAVPLSHRERLRGYLDFDSYLRETGCGTYRCLLGNYDLVTAGYACYTQRGPAREHFGISSEEVLALFGGDYHGSLEQREGRARRIRERKTAQLHALLAA